MVTRSAERVAYQRPAASTSASTSAVVAGQDDRAIGPGRRPALARPPWIAHPFGVGSQFVAQPVSLEPAQDKLVVTLPPFGLEGLEVEREVRREVLVERAPSVADPGGEPSPIACLSADHNSGRRIRDGKRRRLLERIQLRGAADRTARPQGADRRDRLLEVAHPLGCFGERDAVGGVLPRRAADPHPQDQPTPARDLEGAGHSGEERRVAVHHVRDERRNRHPPGPSRGHREDGPGLDDRDREIAAAHEVVPAPQSGIAGLVQANRALEPPDRLRADRADVDADRERGRVARSAGWCGERVAHDA